MPELMLQVYVIVIYTPLLVSLISNIFMSLIPENEFLGRDHEHF